MLAGFFDVLLWGMKNVRDEGGGSFAGLQSLP